MTRIVGSPRLSRICQKDLAGAHALWRMSKLKLWFRSHGDPHVWLSIWQNGSLSPSRDTERVNSIWCAVGSTNQLESSLQETMERWQCKNSSLAFDLISSNNTLVILNELNEIWMELYRWTTRARYVSCRELCSAAEMGFHSRIRADWKCEWGIFLN